MRSGRQIVKMAVFSGNCRGKERKVVAVRDIVQDFFKDGRQNSLSTHEWECCGRDGHIGHVGDRRGTNTGMSYMS